MKRLIPYCLMALVAAPALAQDDLPAYQDDRSSGPALIQSFYNAINRQEYLRAWSYFGANSYADEADETAYADYEAFKAGYADTDFVTLLTGSPTEEGAMGSRFYYVPVALEAVNSKGEHSRFFGCYTLRLAQPSIQDAPPFHPLHIESGDLEPSTTEALDAILPQDCTP